MFNIDVRDAIKSNGLYGYQVAEMIGMTEFSFSRLLARKELTPERKQQIFDAIRGHKENAIIESFQKGELN